MARTLRELSNLLPVFGTPRQSFSYTARIHLPKNQGHVLARNVGNERVNSQSVSKRTVNNIGRWLESIFYDTSPDGAYVNAT